MALLAKSSERLCFFLPSVYSVNEVFWRQTWRLKSQLALSFYACGPGLTFPVFLPVTEFQRGRISFPDSPAKPQSGPGQTHHGIKKGQWGQGSAEFASCTATSKQQSQLPPSMFGSIPWTALPREPPRLVGFSACSCRLISDPTYRIDSLWEMDKSWLR